MVCPMCLTSLHSSCVDTSCDCRNADHSANVSSLINSESEAEDLNDETDYRPSASRSVSKTRSSRTSKRTANLKDQQSTGRKRAASLYPLDSESPCEWRLRINCGGGTSPIIGCISGIQQARHHGPDKNVINNELGNVHRICHYCHNRWHAKNDANYNWNEPTETQMNAHAPKPMNPEQRSEAALLELAYKAKKIKPIKD